MLKFVEWEKNKKDEGKHFVVIDENCENEVDAEELVIQDFQYWGGPRGYYILTNSSGEELARWRSNKGNLYEQGKRYPIDVLADQGIFWDGL